MKKILAIFRSFRLWISRERDRRYLKRSDRRWEAAQGANLRHLEKKLKARR